MSKTGKIILLSLVTLSFLFEFCSLEFEISARADPGLTEMSLTIEGTQHSDVDTGPISPFSPEMDFKWNIVTSTERYLVHQDDESPIVKWAAKVFGVEMLWNNSMAVNDITVSKNGDYIAAVNNTGIYYFASNNSNPKWWYLQLGTSFKSVVLSANGEYVAAGDNDGYIYYFNNSQTTIGQRSSPTWKSTHLWGRVERGTLDMSDDGEYIVVGGTGVTLYYFAGCRGRSSLNEDPTWSNVFGVADFLAVHISSDGRYVAAGGANWPSGGFVVFYTDALEAPYPSEPSWNSRTSINSTIKDLAVSDDGYSVVAIDTTFKTLYYWANATTLSGDPDATWTNDGLFNCVDMSADGDEVIAGTSPLFPCGLHFWTNARLRSGPNQEEDWAKLKGEIVLDVVTSDDGSIIAAAGQIGRTSIYKAYFFKSDGNVIGEFDLLHPSPVVSMSGNGNIVAVGGPTFYSLYVFKMITDSTPPAIESIYQQPTSDSVYPDDEVTVYANVTDDQSGVKQVILNYTTNNGTWFTINATNPDGNVWNATIPAFPYCTDITYVIIAEDNAYNTITTEGLGYDTQYHVIPEFPSLIVLPLFMITTLLAVIVHRRKHSKQACMLSRVSYSRIKNLL